MHGGADGGGRGLPVLEANVPYWDRRYLIIIYIQILTQKMCHIGMGADCWTRLKF